MILECLETIYKSMHALQRKGLQLHGYAAYFAQIGRPFDMAADEFAAKPARKVAVLLLRENDCKLVKLEPGIAFSKMDHGETETMIRRLANIKF